MQIRRKRLWICLALLTITLAVVCWFEPTGVVRGWLRGEAFYQGRPTNYWSRELERWNRLDVTFFCFGNAMVAVDGLVVESDEVATTTRFVMGNAPGQANNALWIDVNQAVPQNLVLDLSNSYSRSPGLFDRLAERVGVTLPQPERPALFEGDPDAEPVLRELLDDPSPTVRDHARRGLERINGRPFERRVINELAAP